MWESAFAPTSTDALTSPSQTQTTKFTFLRAEALRDDKRRAQLFPANRLLRYQEIRDHRPDALVTLVVTELQAYRHELVGRFLIIPHRWRIQDVPDLTTQLRTPSSIICPTSAIEFVWCDYLRYRRHYSRGAKVVRSAAPELQLTLP